MATQFTLQELDWKSWLPILDINKATPEQCSVLTQSNPKALESEYYRLLIVAPEILAHRSAAYNEIMYGKNGASKAERELAALTTSRENGCAYCAFVHANRLKEQTNEQTVIDQLLFDDKPEQAGNSSRENAIIKFTLKLTRTPDQLNQNDIERLIHQGLSPEEILDIIYASSMFSWANRLMLALGQSQQVCLFS